MSILNGNAARYGIYFSPNPGTELHEFGSRWLGRDAISGESLNPDLPSHIEREEWLRVTESPRRYGFHATLKPPFRLLEDASFDDLRMVLHDFAANHERFEAPALKVGTLGRFLAFILSEPDEGFSQLAADCVSEFERFRAPATEEELTKRLHDSLSSREREYVLRWGYPYVFDTWKFHMSLTGSLPQAALRPLEEHLRHRFAQIDQQPLAVESICIFHEPYPGGPFRVIERAQLRSS